MRSFSLAAGLLLALGGVAVALGPDTSPWPMRSANGSHSSWSSQSGINKPKVSWTRTTPGAANPRNYMGVVLGSDQTIYVGGRSVFEALNPDGSVKWNPGLACGDSWGTPAVDDSFHVFVSSVGMVFSLATSNGAVNASRLLWSGSGYATVGGGGAIAIDGSAHVFVSYGDETEVPALYGGFGGQHSNVYAFTNTLSSYFNFIATGTAGTNGTGASFFTQLGELITPYTVNTGGLARFNIGSGSEGDIILTNGSQQTLYGPVMESSIRSDDSFILTEGNSGQTACAAGTTAGGLNDYHLTAFNYSGGTNAIAWRKCDVKWGSFGACAGGITGWCNHLSVPVSSNVATTYLLNNLDQSVYAVSNSTGGTVWKYNVGALFPLVGNISPLTLTAGNNALYFSYCPTAGSSSLTRLVSLNANTGALNWDVGVSTAGCYAGQLVPGTGGRMYLYNGPDVLAFEESGVASVSFSSSPAVISGNVWMSTISASIVAASSGVPVELLSINTSGAGLSATTNGSASPGIAVNTDNSGVSKFLVRWDLSAVQPDQYALAVSSLVLAVPGLGNTNFYFKESRPASVSASTTPAVQQGAGGVVRVSTLTFTVRDSAGSPVPNVPCRFTSAGGNSLSDSPAQTIWPTTSIGTSTVFVQDDLTTLAPASFAAYATTHTFACLGLATQQIVMKENRVASIAISTGVPSIAGSLRVSTLTVTLRDGLGSPVPNVPVALDPIGSLATLSTAAIPANGLKFSVTNGAGQAQILVNEDYGPVPNASYAGMVSSFTLRVLSAPDTPLYLKEQRVASLTLSTGTPTVLVDGNNVPTLRVSTLTFTLKDASGAVVPNVPIWLDSSLLTYVLAPSWIGAGIMPVSDGAGQAQYLVQERVDGVALPALNRFSGLVSTLTYQVAGLADTAVPLKEQRVASVSFSSSPAVMQGDFRVFYVTATVKDATGAGVPNVPVALSRLNFPFAGTRLTTFAPESTSSEGLAATNGAGVASIMVKQDVFNYLLSENGNGYDYTEFAVFNASYSINVPQLANVTVGGSETRAASYTVTVSSPVLQSDVRFTTITVTVLNQGGQPVPNVPVAVTTFTRAGGLTLQKLVMDTARGSAGDYAGLATDASGKATFALKLNGLSGTTYDTFDDFYASVTVVPMNLGFSTVPFLVESNKLDHYNIAVPTGTAVGVAFGSTVTAANVYNHQLSSYTESGINLVPFFTGTNVQGTGTLGTSITGAFTGGSYVVPQQTYNRIENIQIKASRQSDGKNGKSGTITVSGPDHFVIAIPTGAPAGQVFVATITAVDIAGNQVVGYSATLALSAVVWNSTGTPAAGALTVTNVNMPANGVLMLANESYNKGGGIRIRAFDSAANIVGYSSSMTVTQPPMTIDHYGLQFPAGVSVGVPFRMEIDALNASSAPVTYSLDRAINVQSFIAGTGLGIAGSGSLGNSNVTIVAGSTYAVVAAQTYNKIETLQLKGTDQDGIVGASTFTLTVNGPNHFDVVMPTAAQAGQSFQMTVVARDASNNQVLGYNGTVALASVQAATTSLSGAGVLGVTSLNLSGGQATTAFQTYTKAEGIRLRVSDSGIGVTSYSSSMTATPGPPASLTILANPQSTVAGVASVLTSTVLDLYNNPVAGSTVTFQLLTGSGTLALGITGLPSAVTSTNAVAGANGAAQAFFASTNTLSAQADVLRAQIGALLADTTVYNAVLIGPAGGTIVNFGDPNTKAVVPANAYGYNVRLAVNEGGELAASDVALATAAMAKSPNTFISTFTAKISAVLDSNPSASAGNASQLVTVQFPFAADASSNVTVGSFRGASLRPSSLLVPFSVMRVFKLNQATSVFEMVLDGTNLPSIANRAVSAQVSDPNGIYALGAPPFTPVSAGSSATVTTALASGATATVTVPFGAFATPVVLQVGLPSAGSVPALPGNGMTGTGITISVSAGGVQPVGNVGVTIGYTAAGIGGANPDTLRIARYDSNTGWILLDSQVDTVGRTVTGQTNHFSLFQIVAVAAAANVSQGYAFPNPFRPSQGHTAIGFANLPASAHIKIFSVSGRLLKELDADTTGHVTGWDGSDSSGRPLPSGVYIAVFINGSDKRTFKFAVQR